MKQLRERLQIRIDHHSKALLQKASEYTGSSMSEFILSNSLAAADKVIEENEAITLSNHDWNIFYDALVNPPKLNRKLKNAILKYKATQQEN